MSHRRRPTAASPLATRKPKSYRSRLTALFATLALIGTSFIGGIAPAAAAPPSLEASETNIDFGDVFLGETATKTIELTNISPTPITATGSSGGTSAPFGGGQSCQYKTLAPGQSCNIIFTFTPTTTGHATTTSTPTFNGINFTFNLTGTGIGEDWMAFPTTLDFGSCR